MSYGLGLFSLGFRVSIGWGNTRVYINRVVGFGVIGFRALGFEILKGFRVLRLQGL